MSEHASSTRSRSGRAGRVGALHERAGAWRLAIAEASGESGARIVETARLDAGDARALRAALARARVERLLCVAPGGGVVARLVELPDGDDDAIEQALELMAEAQLPAQAPWHRRGWGPIGAPATSGHRAALLVGWVGAGEAPAWPDHERWVAEPAALALLLRTGDEPRWAVALDRAEGSVTLVGHDGARAVARSTRVAAEGWDEGVRRVLRETAPWAEGAAAPGADGLLLDERTRADLATRAGDAADEIGEFGVAAAAALGAASAPSLCDTLFDLSAEEPRARLNAWDRTAAWLASPRRSWGLVGVLAALCLIAAWGGATLNRSILAQRVATLDEAKERGASVDELMKRAAFYGELERRRWPMTKLLSELSGAAPVGVEADTIQLTAGDRFSVRGIAESAAQVNAFADALADSGVFAEVNASTSTTRRDDTPVIEFDLSGRVAAPLAEARGLEDFAEESLSMRLYGEEVPLVREGEGDAEPEGGGSGSRRAGSRGGVFDSAAGGREAEPDPVPEALTDERIGEMDRAEVVREFGERSRAAARADIEDDVKRRLRDEVGRLRDRLRELR